MKKTLNQILFLSMFGVIIFLAVNFNQSKTFADENATLVGKNVMLLMNDHSKFHPIVEDLGGVVVSTNDQGLFLNCTKRGNWFSKRYKDPYGVAYTGSSLDRPDYKFTLYVPWSAILFVKLLPAKK